ncbi:MAG: hypothetical protein KAS66_10485 [Candidatus Omnitrophica bacterium]|nr:hypothetical protein [Candidatus Omnitrophota bacterium]
MPSFLEQLIYNFTKINERIASLRDMMVGTSGMVERGFYYRNSSKNRKFKSNQRKERKSFRRKKMMASAR